jgi:hypothetical protein
MKLAIYKPLFAGLVAAVVLAGCSTTPPPRPDYNGADSVAGISEQMLVGQWQGRVLNPIKGESTEPFQVAYNENGSVVLNSKDTQSGLGLEFEVLGTWSIDGETVTVNMESITETSGNQLGALITRFGSAMKDKAPGTRNIYEASADRLVIVSDDGQAQELVRK